MLAALALAVLVLAPLGPQQVEVRSPDFGNDRTILKGADDGLLRSTDGGASWEAVELPGSGAVNAIVFEDGFAYDGYVVVLRSGATAAMSRNGRRDFEWLPVPDGGRLHDVLLGSGFGMRGAMSLACGAAGVWSSSDFGETWSPDSEGLPSDDEVVDLSSERNAEGRVVETARLLRSGTFRRLVGAAWEPADPGDDATVAPDATTGRVPADEQEGPTNGTSLALNPLFAVVLVVAVVLIYFGCRRRGATP